MSNTLYPLLERIERIDVTPMSRVLRDPFEDGSSSARLLWADKQAKRRFVVQHTPLSHAEQRILRGFLTERNQTYDSFWFRDNPNRAGNASVRFASPVTFPREGELWTPRVDLEEVAPVRLLPDLAEIYAAAGNVLPKVWYDANREGYFTLGTTITTPAGAYDEVRWLDTPWQPGGALPLGNVAGQWQHYAFTGTQWARSSANSGFGTAVSAPEATLFAICRHSTTSTLQIICASGAHLNGYACGIALDAANNYAAWMGHTTATNAKQANSPADTWRSVAAVWHSTANEDLYLNGNTPVGDSVVRNNGFGFGPWVMGAAFDGTLKSNPSGAMTNANVAHLLLFEARLTQSQIRALHNLFAYQFSLALV